MTNTKFAISIQAFFVLMSMRNGNIFLIRELSHMHRKTPRKIYNDMRSLVRYNLVNKKQSPLGKRFNRYQYQITVKGATLLDLLE